MGEFAKRANAVLKKAEASGMPVDWRTTADEQIARMRKHVPMSADVAMERSLEALGKLRELAYQLGFNMRMGMASPVKPEYKLSRNPSEAMIGLPKEAGHKVALLHGITDPMRAWSQSAAGDLSERAKRRLGDRMKVTENPMTSPTFLPAAAIAVPNAFREGASDAEKTVRVERTGELDSELEAAKRDFEDALQAEYMGRKKIASAGELLDGLAGMLIEKSADGELATAANAYLALAALLGYGAHNASKAWVDKRDPARQEQKLLHHALRQRAIDRGVPVFVDFKELPAARTEAVPDTAEAVAPEIDKVAAAPDSEIARLYNDVASMKIPARTMWKHLKDMLQRGYTLHAASGMGRSTQNFIRDNLTKRISGIVR